MYDCTNIFALSYASTDFLGHSPVNTVNAQSSFPSAPPPFDIPANHHPGNELESVLEVLTSLKAEAGNSPCYGSPSPSLPSYYLQPPSLIQKSLSSNSLPRKDEFQNPIFSTHEILDLATGPVRKAFSTGDLDKFNSSQSSGRAEILLSQENRNTDGSNEVRRYSAEERKERIERYRSKRNQRNFNKKIKYACRKTLADSRPRIRGRFARNEEIEQIQYWSQMNMDEDEDDDYAWINLLNTFAANLIP